MEIFLVLVTVISALLLLFGAMFGGFIYDVFASGFVISKLWVWFIVGTFHLAPIPLLTAAGIALLVRYLTAQLPSAMVLEQEAAAKVSGKSKAINLGTRLAYPWITLLFGYIITLL
jgi:hypothetical protein